MDDGSPCETLLPMVHVELVGVSTTQRGDFLLIWSTADDVQSDMCGCNHPLTSCPQDVTLGRKTRTGTSLYLVSGGPTYGHHRGNGTFLHGTNMQWFSHTGSTGFASKFGLWRWRWRSFGCRGDQTITTSTVDGSRRSTPYSDPQPGTLQLTSWTQAGWCYPACAQQLDSGLVLRETSWMMWRIHRRTMRRSAWWRWNRRQCKKRAMSDLEGRMRITSHEFSTESSLRFTSFPVLEGKVISNSGSER